MPTFDTPGQVLLRLSLGAGEVTIETAEAPEVVVDVVPLRNDDASREAVAQTRVELLERGGRPEVVVQAPKRRGFSVGRDAKLGVRIRCPHGSDLDLSTSSADLDAHGRLAEVRAKTASGDLALADVDGSLDANTASGDVRVGSVAGTATVSTASGDVELRHLGGDLSASLVSGDLTVGETLGAIAVNTVSGDVRIDSAGDGNLRLQSVSGDIELGIRPGLRVWIDATSLSGTMSSELDMSDIPPADDSALVELRAKTVSGDVQIRRAVQAGAGG